ncbi:MAG: hypothetical protein ACK4TA_10290 [Saprospiraceae bacterium]
MKNFQMFSFAFILLFVSISFQSCEKETAETVFPADNHRWIVIGLGRQYNSCRPGGLLCIRTENLLEKEAFALPLDLDHAVTKPIILEDGSLQMEMKVSIEQLSPELRAQLLEKKALVVEEGFQLPEHIMQQAYINSELQYKGQQAEVPKGVYRVVAQDGNGTAPQLLTITITIKFGKVTISVSW